MESVHHASLSSQFKMPLPQVATRQLLADALDDHNVPDELLEERLVQERNVLADHAENNAWLASLDVMHRQRLAYLLCELRMYTKHVPGAESLDGGWFKAFQIYDLARATLLDPESALDKNVACLVGAWALVAKMDNSSCFREVVSRNLSNFLAQRASQVCAAQISLADVHHQEVALLQGP
mmetsp:Transcript_100397/g.193800  ORF Transcript_100397/g.193800 Transcript_100397/m.193800 type:complete len:181 (+) Transcript_100397:68-610(+)